MLLHCSTAVPSYLKMKSLLFLVSSLIQSSLNWTWLVRCAWLVSLLAHISVPAISLTRVTIVMLFLIDIWFLLIILMKKLYLKSYQYCKIHHIRLAAALFIMLSFLLAALLQQDTVFDPVSLTCGHIFCYMRACKAGSVTIVDGLKAASPKEKCPLCREVNT